MAPDPQCSALAAAMHKSGLSYAQIAAKINKPEQHVIDVCTGTVKPTEAEFNALAGALGIKESVTFSVARATKTARKEAAEEKVVEVQDERDTALLAQVHAQQMAEVEAQLKNLTMQQAAEQAKFEQSWQVREKSLWERIEAGIKVEQDKEFARLEAERKVREEEERKRQEEQRKRDEAQKQKEEAERQKKEAEEKQRQEAQQKKAADEEQKRKEDQQRQADEQAAQAKNEQAEQRKALGETTAMDDWRAARENLMRLKKENTRVVKGNAQAKSTWGNLRRQVVRKIGQVTNDESEITRIPRNHRSRNSASGSSILLNAFYSSIAKAVLLQAETEVTAEKASAMPIARVAHRLLATLDGLADVFFAKLVQRVGGWPVPAIPPKADFDGREWKDSHERFGYRVSQDTGAMETTPQHIERVTGIMRVYFHILATPPRDKPIASRFFQTPRYWVWFARVLNSRSLLASDVCISLVHAALEIFGADARKIWGKQWTKVLALIYDLVNNGIGEGKPLGGTSPEGTAGRLRIKLEIDKIMGVGN
uniref:mRNA export factor GLE1 n=1 Tax=Schizophyllum commune (strain H4-8 / FGSC 9210) TaxID=578458 RepID=D8QLY3_SCHCM